MLIDHLTFFIMHKATLYETNNSMQQLDAAKLLSQYIDQFKWTDNESVLDVGCGPGNVTSKLLLPNLPKSVVKLVRRVIRNLYYIIYE